MVKGPQSIPVPPPSGLPNSVCFLTRKWKIVAEKLPCPICCIVTKLRLLKTMLNTGMLRDPHGSVVITAVPTGKSTQHCDQCRLVPINV